MEKIAWISYLRELNVLSLTLRIVLAVFCGGIIGYERGKHQEAAGFRTHILVCVGSACTMLVGQYMVTVLGQDSFAQSVAPFFAADFDVVLIDPRYFSAPVYTTVIEENAAAVVILMNADTFTSSPVLRALPRGTDR